MVHRRRGKAEISGFCRLRAFFHRNVENAVEIRYRAAANSESRKDFAS
jgi:hypothetical protein